jgi:hypothetical protein
MEAHLTKRWRDAPDQFHILMFLASADTQHERPVAELKRATRSFPAKRM